MEKFVFLVWMAAGVLSAAKLDSNKWQKPVISKQFECGDLERLSRDATTIFDYVGETRNTIRGSTPDDTGLMMKARIYIFPLKACKFSMQVNDVELLVKSKTQDRFLAASESYKFGRELQAQELTFKFANGKIWKLFPSHAESIHVLNIKRGILSTLQLGTQATREEVDVNGRCKVKVVEKEDGAILKSKNISECSERALNEIGFQTRSFQQNDLPIKPLTSTSVCTYTTSKDSIRSVNCLETHLFRAFSAGYKSPSGAITIVRQKLTFFGTKFGHLSSSKVTDSGPFGVSLIYQHEKEAVKPDKSIIDRTDKIMKNLVDNSRINNFAAKQSSAHDFTKLVELFRKLNKKTMIPVWEKYFDCEKSRSCDADKSDIKDTYRQYLLDALTYCGTETCIYTVQNVIINGEISGETMNTFLQGIALVAKPTKGMIRDVLNIATKKSSRQVFLTLGTLMYRYCSANPSGCAYDVANPITHAERFLEERLGHDCLGQEQDDRVETILMALKAIGNAGRPVHAWKTLMTCAQTSVHQNISIAALDALRRMPCSQKIQNELHKLHENIELDPERRIHVYLALMKCPTENTLRRVTKQLEEEKSRQVGSFMASHLKNLNESSDPRHKKTQKYLSTILKRETLKMFDLDRTQYSRAWEGSLHSDWLKSGASIESHVIFNSDGYMPRSAFLNMTATILDVPINILEMAARIEGLETLMEDFFGPDGYFPDNNILKLFDITFTKDDIAKLRTKRDVKDDTIDVNIAELHQAINKKRARPSGALNIKLFGHEMRVFSYDDIFSTIDKIDNMNVIELLLKVARGGHKTFTKSMLFLEMTHTVPTCLGLPLRLKLTGSTVASLEFNGKFDIRNLFWGPSSMEVKGFIRPSAVVELAGQMGIHSHYVDSGIFVNSSMFTSQTLKGAVVYKEGQTLQINVDAPEEPNQLFNISSTPFLFLNEEVHLVEGAPRRISPDFCINSTMIFGLGLCTRLSLPVAFREYEAPFFPLSGSSSFGMNLIKADHKLTTYQFSINMKKVNSMTRNERIGWFEMGTPGATYSRNLAGIIKYVETRTSKTITLGSFEGGTINDELIKNKIEFRASYLNNTNRFEMDLSSNLFTKKTMKLKFLYFNDTHIIGTQMGILMSAEYDWYKFQHIMKFVNKTASYLLHSRTTYWPKKHLTGEIEVVKATRDIMLRFDANQINQSVEMLGKYIKTENETGLKFTATHLSTMFKTSFYVGILNKELTKKFIINGTVLGKKVEFIWGYYMKDIVRQLRFDVDIAGKTMGAFAVYKKLSGSLWTASTGITNGKHKIGISTQYVKKSFDRKLCGFMFYNDKEPLKICLALENIVNSQTTPEFKRLVWTITILNKSLALAFDYKTNDDKYGLTTTATFGDRLLFKNNLELIYDTIWNTELKVIMEVGKKTVSARWFSTMLKEDFNTFGFEARGWNQTLKLMARYSKKMKEETAIRGVLLEGQINNKTFPVNLTIIHELGKTIQGLNSILKINSYKMSSSILFIQPEENKYSAVVDFAVSKGNFVIFRNKLTDILIWSDVQKATKLLWEFMIWNKKFEYGWDVTYQNRSTVNKMAHALSFGLNYARNKRSVVTTTLFNSDQSIGLLIDVEYFVKYLLQRQVSHVIRFDKEARQLDVRLEFLPKMFVKFMGRLDKIDGWKLTTDLTFDWINYRRVLHSMATYIKRTDTNELSYQFSAFGQTFMTSIELNYKTSTGIFTVSGFGRSLILKGNWLHGEVSLSTQKKGVPGILTQVFAALMKYNKENGGISLELRSPVRRLFRTVYSYDKYRNIMSLDVFALERSILVLSGQYKKTERSGILHSFIFGKERFQVIGKYNKEDSTLSLTLDFLKKNRNITFAAKWDAKKKQVSFSTEVFNRIFGFVARLDPGRYVSSLHAMYQKRVAGWSVYLDQKTKTLVYNITLTPSLSGQIVSEIADDRIVKLTFQRKIGINIVNETILRYELSKESSKLAFQWNKGTLNAINNAIAQTIDFGIKNITILAQDLKSLANKLGIYLITNITTNVMTIINKGEQYFDKFDFVSARDKMCDIASDIIKRSAKLTSLGLEKTSYLLTKTRKNLPVIMRETIKITRKAMKLTKLTYKIAKNLTESGMPIVKTAIKLAKEFKIKEKTFEQISKQVLDMMRNMNNAWKEKMGVQLKGLLKNATEYILETQIPYSSETVGEIYAYLLTRADKFDWEQTTKNILNIIVLEYEIAGQPLKEHVNALIRKVVKLPKIIEETRVYIKTTTKYLMHYINEVEYFLSPLINHLTRINISIYKHFLPLVRNAVKVLESMASSVSRKVYGPLNVQITELIDQMEKFFMPLLRPFRPLYIDLREQIRGIRILEQEIGSVFDRYMKDFKIMCETKSMEIKIISYKMIEKSKLSVNSLTTMTAEEITEAIVDNIAIFVNKNLVYLKNLYKSRAEIMNTLKVKSNKIFDIAKDMYNVVTSTRVDDLVHVAFLKAGESVDSTLKHTVIVIDQIAMIDVLRPLKNLWKELDLLIHFKKFGINDKMTDVINTVKSINLTETLLKAIGNLRNWAVIISSKTDQKVMEMYGNTLEVYKYIVSIPKKTFEQFYTEVENVLKNKMEMKYFITNIYLLSLEQLQKMSFMLEEMYTEYYDIYSVPLKNMYFDIKENALRVYEDNKDASVKVYNYYKAVIAGLLKRIENKYDDVYKEVSALYNNYADMTWGEIGLNIGSYGQNKGEIGLKYANERLEKAKILAKKVVKHAKKFYTNIIIVGNKTIYYMTFVRPRLINIYVKAVSYINTTAMLYYNRASQMLLDNKVLVFNWYINNKNKSLRMLYLDIQNILIDQYEKNMVKAKQVLPVLKEEAENIINQTLRSTVILANETVKLFSPHYTIVKGYVKSYYNNGKDHALEIYTISKGKVTTLYKKALEQFRLKTKTFVKLFKDLLEMVKDHPAYKKLINHAFVGKAISWLEDVSENIGRQINNASSRFGDLRQNSNLIALKDKLTEYKRLMNEHPIVEGLNDILKQINESGLYTILRLKEKLTPQVANLRKSLVKIPDLVLWKINFFQQYPEKCFWTTVKNVISVLDKLKSSNWETIRGKAWKATADLIDEITDKKTKEAAIFMTDISFTFYKNLRLLRSQYLEFCNKTRNWLNKQWKQSPLYPIINHEIWGAYAEELLNHEIVSELKSLVLKGKYAFLQYKRNIISYDQLSNAELKDRVIKFVTKIDAKFNTFLDETILEDVVLTIKQLYNDSKTLIKGNRDRVVQAWDQVSKVASRTFLVYNTTIKVIGDKYMEDLKTIWRENYSKLVEKASLIWNKTLTTADVLKKNYIKLANEIRENYTTKALQLWNDSQLKEKVLIVKDMTVRDTLNEIMKLSETTKTAVKRLYSKALIEAKTSYDVYLLPFTNIAEKNVRVILNEINETAMFIYRYYSLKDNFHRVKDYLSTIKTMTKSKLKGIAPKVPLLLKLYLKKVGKSSLKAVYLSMAYVENFGVTPLVTKMKAYIAGFKTYVNLNTNNGELIISIPHYKPIDPSLTHHISKIVDQIRNLSDTLQTFSASAMNKTTVAAKLLLEQVAAKTREIRQDLNTSMLIHNKLRLHVWNKITVMTNEAYNITKEILWFVKIVSNDKMKDARNKIRTIYLMTEMAASDIYNATSISEAFEKTKEHYEIFLNHTKSLILPIESDAKHLYKFNKRGFYELLNIAKPHYIFVKTAITNWRNGSSDLRTAFQVVDHYLKKIFIRLAAEFVAGGRQLFDVFIGRDTREVVEEYIKIHAIILRKYAQWTIKLYKFTKGRMDRKIRIAEIMAAIYWRRPFEVMNPYKSVAMIFGKSHIITFDSKYYDVTPHAHPRCTYLLARDFQRGNFTILRQKEHLIVMTPDMMVKIHMNGKVQSVIKTVKSGLARKEIIDDLPVQSDTGSCKRMDTFIKCEFKQGLRIKCDTEHFLCTIELSGWHYSKSQGLLGTNNHEVYDEMKLPDGTITKSVTNFINSWEVSGDSSCLRSEYTKVPACNKAPSEKCFKLLKRNTSTYASSFAAVNPIPFFKACLIDSSECETDEPYETSHCNATAAFVHMLSLKGIWVPLPKDCGHYTSETGETHNVGDEWVQASSKAVDMVIMISERSRTKSTGRSIASLIFNLNKNLLENGYTSRFALIGFGGNGIYEHPHYHTPNGNLFNDATTVGTTIKNMAYTGSSSNWNDAYGAMILASKLKFRAGAARHFMLFNFDTLKSSWFGPSLDETVMSVKYESNATLFVFDNFRFKKMGERKIIGLTNKKVYLLPNQILPTNALEFPASPFTTLVKQTRGGMFSNTLNPSQDKITDTALIDSLLPILKSKSLSCKSCILTRKYTDQAIPMCRSNNRVQC